ncbi:sulfatase [Polaribacter sp.]|uniref:sulfatase n=1 Tax=Polaribacter sp. TaxID=1920175 RepID=UPI0025DF16C3|nr:sulfatase [Polaribacter sp.]
MLTFFNVLGQQKNVLFIVVDDLRPELGCYGNPIVKSPNIDKLASEGIVFEKAYCQQAVCGPSRASFLSGLRPNSTNVFDLKTRLQESVPNTLTLPLFFKNKGYEVISLGKIYHNRGENGDDPNSWTELEWHPQGQWKGRGYLTKEAQSKIYNTNRKKGVGPSTEKAAVSDNMYPDGVLADEAIDRLKGFKKSGKPFFLACGFQKPHLPFNAPKRYWDIYNPETLYQTSQKSWPVDMPKRAGNKSGELKSYTDIPQKKKNWDKSIETNLIHGYYASVSYVDAQIGKVVEELDRLDLRKSTIIVLLGDHGWKLNDYGAWCKHTNFEIDARVPLIISAPQYKTNKNSPALVELVDVYPTLADFCNFEIPTHCEGASLIPLLKKPNKKWKQVALSQYPTSGSMRYSIRSGKWRYTEWIDKENHIVERELYDHSKSQLADRNYAKDKKYQSIVKKLSKQLDKGNGWKKFQK